MSNRGRHRKKKEEYIIQIVQGIQLPYYKYTEIGMTYLHNIHIFKNYKLFINKQNLVCRIEEDIENQNNIWSYKY